MPTEFNQTLTVRYRLGPFLTNTTPHVPKKIGAEFGHFIYTQPQIYIYEDLKCPIHSDFENILNLIPSQDITKTLRMSK